ncbi:hypothetical protein [Fulvivirga lutea]|uniref:Uncharacterized protein n=1 Tax=Fulvivirga lutea TaxID=2810512 RepID=A0A975A1A6_9BACT|nr:hypothetical protein [Fulvivirga lutea]QSE97317.1 hypothetical protein JR347_17300 [Fulvivirga lutea]
MLKKINKSLRKYSPIINAVGIILILVGLYFNYLEINSTDKLEDNPMWRTDVIRADSNPLQDELKFTALNDLYNIQKVTICLFGAERLSVYEYSSNSIGSYELKNELNNVYNYYFNLDTYKCQVCREEDSYPFVAIIDYEKFGKRYRSAILYNYHYVAYLKSKSSDVKFKSESIEFVRSVSLDSSSIARELILFNANNSFLSNFPNGQLKAKSTIAHNNKKYKPFINLIGLNLSEFIHVIKVEGIDYTLSIKLPLELYDSTAKAKKRLYDKQLLEALSTYDYDQGLVDQLNEIEIYKQEFSSTSASINFDAMINKKDTIVNQEVWNRWYQMNNKLLKSIIDKIEM